MKKISSAIDRFAMKHPNFGVQGLMRYIVIGNVIVYLLACFAGYDAVSFLAFNWLAICHGEVWRLVTFIFMPGFYSVYQALYLILFLFLYYMIGITLEREWGTAKFNLYYLFGVILTILVGMISGIAWGNSVIEGADYVNQSMFFAFAMLYPETQFLIMYIIPVKVKWLAWLEAAAFAVTIFGNLLILNWLNVLLPLIALLNFFVFFWEEIRNWLDYRRGVAKRQTSHQTINFKQAAQKQKEKETARGYRHKCEVCGRTDTEYPELEFRYCSRCEGYHCYCMDHIFNHEHITK